jgi:hypothetical protein
MAVRNSLDFVSIGSFAALVLFSTLHNPMKVSAFVDDVPDVVRYTEVYVVMSLIADYFKLFKTRVILSALTGQRVGRLSLLFAILCADVAVGFLVFHFFTYAIAVIVDSALDFGFGTTLNALLSVSLPRWVLGLPLTLRPVLWHFDFPISNLFWAGMVPSIWLWLYIAGSLLVRLIASSEALLRFLTYFLDIREHPIRSAGVVAAVLVSGGYTAYVIGSNVIA